MEQKELIKRFHMQQKQKSLERLNSRQVERKMLTYRSNQPGLKFEEVMTYGDMENTHATRLLASDLSSKRSPLGQIKDPTSHKDTRPLFWSMTRINQCTPGKIKSIIPSKILEKD